MSNQITTNETFRNSPNTNPIQEIALRVVAELPGWELHVLGTATLIAGNLAITAKHVLDAALQFGHKVTADGIEINSEIKLYQCLPLETGPVYRIWTVIQAWAADSDIAILHLKLDRSSEDEPRIEWRVPRLRVTPPPTGRKVIAFGYRESKIEVITGPDGTHHITLNDFGTISIGEVGQNFPERRDSSFLKFPCYEVLAKFVPGMSGGLILDEYGILCGLVCAGTIHSDPDAPPLSYAVSLWPILRPMISADRGNAYGRGVQYPVVDLALDKLINVVDLELLDPELFPTRNLPRGI